MKYLLSLGLVLLLSNPFNASAQDALYSKADFEKILQTYSEVVVVIPGFDYKYVGNWLSTMEIVGDHTLVFSRGRVVHSYDLSKVVMVQEEGNYVKLWFK
jgi:hypothetical protein